MRQVASVPGENHVMFHGLSPDGRTLAVGWDRGSGANVERGAYLLDLRTGRRTALPHLNNAPSFSPDGRHLISANYASDRSLKTELVELDRRDGSARTFASGPSGEWLGSYASDGRWILFNSTRTGASDLYRIRRADGRIERLTDDPRYEAHAQFFDHDRQVIFHRQTAGDDFDIVIRDLSRRAERAVGVTPAEEGYPAISPDRRWIAFSAVTKAGQQPNLFVMRADGSGRRQLTAGPSKDAYATWSRDGRSIMFVRFAPGGSKIMRLAVRNGNCRN
ncbi:MAG: hypothetical protein ABIT68_10940 [Sphingomicrobium sp.]